jgi:glyoxylase-like metal-dependent hydrolase (beta-lactamase superfamily II)
MVCHCLLIEHEDGLVLVDTGLGTADIADPVGRLGGGFVKVTRPRLSQDETALAQIEALGFRRADVRHIVPTHLDLDHAGGLSDFPDATVHVFAREHAAATARSTVRERERYRAAQLAHGPKWQLHETSGEQWLGFESVRALTGSDGDVLLVPLVGHTRGHCGVAVRTPEGWLLHAGDAYFSHREMDPEAPSCPPGLAAFQRLVAIDDRARRANQRRLRALAKEHRGDVTVFCAHAPVEYDALAARTHGEAPRRARHAFVN